MPQGTLESLNLPPKTKRKKANPLNRLQQAELLVAQGDRTTTPTLQERVQSRGDLGSPTVPAPVTPAKKKNKKKKEGFPDRSPY